MSGEFPLKIGEGKIKATKAWILYHLQRELVHFMALLIIFQTPAFDLLYFSNTNIHFCIHRCHSDSFFTYSFVIHRIRFHLILVTDFSRNLIYTNTFSYNSLQINAFQIVYCIRRCLYSTRLIKTGLPKITKRNNTNYIYNEVDSVQYNQCANTWHNNNTNTYMHE